MLEEEMNARITNITKPKLLYFKFVEKVPDSDTES